MTWDATSGRVPDDDVLLIDDYLTIDQCRSMTTELDFVLWRASEVVRTAPGGGLMSVHSDERTSRSTTQKWFSVELNSELEELERRFEADFGPPPTHLEQWQAVQYAPGGRFGLHTDGGAFGDDPAGERVLSFLVYLHAPESGGATYFPRLDRLIDPVPGRVVVWRNLHPDGTVNRRFLHAATPTIVGTKTVLTTWSRQHRLRTTAR